MSTQGLEATAYPKTFGGTVPAIYADTVPQVAAS